MSFFYENIKEWIRKEAKESGGDYREFLEKMFDAAGELLDELDDSENQESMITNRESNDNPRTIPGRTESEH